MRILFTSGLGITDRPRRWGTITNKFFVPLAKSFTEMGHKCEFLTNPHAQLQVHEWNCTGLGTAWYKDSLKRHFRRDHMRPDVVFIWNGNSPSDEIVARMAREAGVPIVFGELGWFTQKTTLQFDDKGTGPRSSLRDLSLMGMSDHSDLDSFIWDLADLVGSVRTRPRDYLFVPLQDEADTNISRFSPFDDMAAFLWHVVRQFPDRNIVARPHPHQKDVRLPEFGDKVTVTSEGHLYEWLRGASGVVGINSTVLFEALLFKKPVLAYGENAATGLGVFGEGEGAGIQPKYSMAQEIKIRNLLSEMIFKRSFRRDLLGNTEYTSNYPLFKRLLAPKEVAA